MGAAASLTILPILGGVGYGLTYIKDRHIKVQMLEVNVTKVTKVVETRKTARIFAAIFSCGLTEFMNHKEVSEEIFYEDNYIGSNETEAAEALNKKGNECYKRGDYETAATSFERAFQITKDTGSIKEKYKENLNRTSQKIRQEAEKQQREEAARREREEAVRRERKEVARREQEVLRGEREEAARREQEALRREREQAARREQEALRREREEAAKRKQEIERKAREEALRLERARTLSKSLLEEATNIYQQAEAMSSLELKLENYEVALHKCEESCASGATEEAFKTLNKIFESCLKHDAHDEAAGAVQVVRTYFPSEAGRLQDILVKQQSKTWSPDYQSRVRQQQEENRTIMMMLT